MPEVEDSCNYDKWYARVQYPDGRAENLPVIKIMNFSPTSLTDFDPKDKHIVVSSSWEADKRPHRYEAHALRLAGKNHKYNPRCLGRHISTVHFHLRCFPLMQKPRRNLRKVFEKREQHPQF